jgi:predicted nucleotidyltransferase
MLTQQNIQRLVDQIAQRIEPKKIIVFGSYAKSKAVLHSDLDLLIIKDTSLPMEIRAANLRPLLATVLVNVDVQWYTPEEVTAYASEEHSFLYSVLKTGKVCFEKQA